MECHACPQHSAWLRQATIPTTRSIRTCSYGTVPPGVWKLFPTTLRTTSSCTMFRAPAQPHAWGLDTSVRPIRVHQQHAQQERTIRRLHTTGMGPPGQLCRQQTRVPPRQMCFSVSCALRAAPALHPATMQAARTRTSWSSGMAAHGVWCPFLTRVQLWQMFCMTQPARMPASAWQLDTMWEAVRPRHCHLST